MAKVGDHILAAVREMRAAVDRMHTFLIAAHVPMNGDVRQHMETADHHVAAAAVMLDMPDPVEARLGAVETEVARLADRLPEPKAAAPVADDDKPAKAGADQDAKSKDK